MQRKIAKLVGEIRNAMAKRSECRTIAAREAWLMAAKSAGREYKRLLRVA